MPFSTLLDPQIRSYCFEAVLVSLLKIGTTDPIGKERPAYLVSPLVREPLASLRSGTFARDCDYVEDVKKQSGERLNTLILDT